MKKSYTDKICDTDHTYEETDWSEGLFKCSTCGFFEEREDSGDLKNDRD